jgi:hypothetical protein
MDGKMDERGSKSDQIKVLYPPIASLPPSLSLSLSLSPLLAPLPLSLAFLSPLAVTVTLRFPSPVSAPIPLDSVSHSDLLLSRDSLHEIPPRCLLNTKHPDRLRENGML